MYRTDLQGRGVRTAVTKRPRSAIISFDWSEVVSLVMVEGRWTVECGVQFK